MAEFAYNFWTEFFKEKNHNKIWSNKICRHFFVVKTPINIGPRKSTKQLFFAKTVKKGFYSQRPVLCKTINKKWEKMFQQRHDSQT